MKDPDRLGAIHFLRQTRAGQEMQAKGNAGKEWELHLKSMMKIGSKDMSAIHQVEVNDSGPSRSMKNSP
jgi:hypothetical protein